MAPINGIMKKGISLVDDIANMSSHIKSAAQGVKEGESIFAMSLRDQNRALNVMRKVSKVNKDNMLSYLRKSTTKIDTVITERINAFVTDLEKSGYPKEVLAELKEAKTLGELQAAVINFSDKLSMHFYTPIFKLIPQKNPKSIPLEVEQILYEATNKCNEARRNLYSMFTQHSTEPISAQIEKRLLDKYNIRAYLDNDRTKASQICDAVAWAASESHQLPNEIIVTHYIQGGEHIAWGSGSMHTMLIASTAMDNFAKRCPKATLTESAKSLVRDWHSKTGFKGWLSTDVYAHIPLHEIKHQQHLPLLAFKIKPIPKKFRPVINQLSGYAASKPNAAHEVYTELNTKKLVTGLNEEEMSLFEFLGGKA